MDGESLRIPAVSGTRIAIEGDVYGRLESGNIAIVRGTRNRYGPWQFYLAHVYERQPGTSKPIVFSFTKTIQEHRCLRVINGKAGAFGTRPSGERQCLNIAQQGSDFCRMHTRGESGAS